MTKFLTWLKSLFIHPREESNQMSEPLTDASTGTGTTVQQTETALPATLQQPPAAPAAPAEPAAEQAPQSAVAKAVENVLAGNMVRDFDAAFDFVRDGMEKLGETAKADLITLAKKYL